MLKLSWRKKEYVLFYVIMSPFISMLLCLKLFPYIWGIVISLTNFNGFNLNNLRFVGLKNYAHVFMDNEALMSFVRTLGFSAVFLPVSMIVLNILSLLLCSKIPSEGFFRTVYFLPSLVPVVAAGMVWRNIFLRDGGVLNIILNSVGIKSVTWLGYDYILVSLAILMLWGSGGGVLWTMAAIKAIPEEYFESALIDGANYFQRTIKITIPLISNINFFNLVLGILGMLQIYMQPLVLTAGAANGGLTSVPIRPVYTFMIHIMQQVFVNMRYGYGLALTWLFFIFNITITYLTNKSSRYWVNYEVKQDGGKNDK